MLSPEMVIVPSYVPGFCALATIVID